MSQYSVAAITEAITKIIHNIEKITAFANPKVPEMENILYEEIWLTFVILEPCIAADIQCSLESEQEMQMRKCSCNALLGATSDENSALQLPGRGKFGC